MGLLSQPSLNSGRTFLQFLLSNNYFHLLVLLFFSSIIGGAQLINIHMSVCLREQEKRESKRSGMQLAASRCSLLIWFYISRRSIHAVITYVEAWLTSLIIVSQWAQFVQIQKKLVKLWISKGKNKAIRSQVQSGGVILTCTVWEQSNSDISAPALWRQHKPEWPTFWVLQAFCFDCLGVCVCRAVLCSSIHSPPRLWPLFLITFCIHLSARVFFYWHCQYWVSVETYLVWWGL